jgi:hypothetical protein
MTLILFLLDPGQSPRSKTALTLHLHYEVFMPFKLTFLSEQDKLMKQKRSERGYSYKVNVESGMENESIRDR